jgi:hypothetical protein
MAMNPADRALIVIHRVDQLVRRRYRVVIDGRRAGFVAPGGSTEFPVDPGVHTVEAAIDWVHSLPLRLEVAPASRTDLRIAQRRPGSLLKSLAPVLIALVVASLLTDLLSRVGFLPTRGVSGLLSRLPIFLCLIYAAIRIPPLLIKDYWALWILEPIGGSVPESPSPAEV